MEISTKEAARRLGVTPQRVLRMLRDQQLTGRRIERTWLVDEASVIARSTLTSMPGRPWAIQTTLRIIWALSNRQPLGARDAGALSRLSTDGVAAKIAQAVSVRRFSTRWIEDVPQYLSLTGESAIDRITSNPWRQLHPTLHSVHGYPRRGEELRDVVRRARLVENPEGDVHLYEFEGIDFPWDETPTALIAVDCSRSTAVRVRSVGLDALAEMKVRWSSST